MIRKMVDPMLDEGSTAANIERMFEGIGGHLNAEPILRHRKHYKDDRPLAPKGTRKTDLAILVRDRAVDMFENEELDLRNKEHAPGIAAGLKADKIIKDAEKEKAKAGNTLQLVSSILALVGIGPAPALALDDGNTIEGTAVEVDGETD